MKKEDRNTFLLIVGILVVCLIALFAIFRIIWKIVAEPLRTRVNEVTAFVSDVTSETDYNFEVMSVAKAQEENQKESKEEEKKNEKEQDEQEKEDRKDKDDSKNDNTVANLDPNDPARVYFEPDLSRTYDYNFTVPAKDSTNVGAQLQSFPDAIIDDARLAEVSLSGSETPQVNLQIKIPKINVNSPVFQGYGAEDLLDRGFWVHPASGTLGEGEVMMLCHRRHFGPYDPRSCWYLDRILVGDEITVDYYDVTLKYEVVGTNIFEANDPLIYSINTKGDYIKIVTCTPLYSNAQRLVVLAKRVQ